MLRTWPLLLALLMVIGVSILGCSGAGSPVAPVEDESFRAPMCDPPEPPPPIGACGYGQSVRLMAGQHYHAGYVTVSNDSDNIYVEYTTFDNWWIFETHLAVAATKDGIPQTKKGSPKPGKFPYKATHNPPVQYYLYTIEIDDDWDTCDSLYIAAHAVVKQKKNGGYVNEQTGWGEGDPFDKSWAMYFNFGIESCCTEDLLLPGDPVTAQFNYPYSPYSYWKTTLSNVPDGYHVSNGVYLGWCVDQGHTLYNGSQHQVMLYSSYDPGMPSYAMDPDWPKVNWILNNKGTATIIDIQQAIWYFINGGHDPDNQAGLDLVAGANENPNFKPDLCDDGVIAVIVDPITEGTKQQLTIIEVACVE